MNILIAPNAFKNSLDAEATAMAIEEGLRQSNLKCSCECFPIGDGGDGTGYLITKRCGGTFYGTEVHDPLGRRITASLGLLNESNTAVIELANASGLRLLRKEDLKPLRATSFGTGEQIRYALDREVKKIILCIGGSAVVDGGAGILCALGIRFLDADGKELSGLPENLVDLHAIDLSGFDKRINNCEFVVLCDVSNCLLGKEGAAAVFGPQKGAAIRDVEKLERGLSKLAEVTLRQLGIDIAQLRHGGAAGGTAAGLSAFLHAELVNGIDYFLQLTGFDRVLKNHDLVITGEGSLDEQTLHGKGPYGVASRAKAHGLPVIGIAGKVPIDASESLNEYFDALISISNGPSDDVSAILATDKNLRRAAKALGNVIALKQ